MAQRIIVYTVLESGSKPETVVAALQLRHFQRLLIAIGYRLTL